MQLLHVLPASSAPICLPLLSAHLQCRVVAHKAQCNLPQPLANQPRQTPLLVQSLYVGELCCQSQCPHSLCSRLQTVKRHTRLNKCDLSAGQDMTAEAQPCMCSVSRTKVVQVGVFVA